MSETVKHNPKKRRPQSEWQQIIADYERSGLTQKAFCEQFAIAKSSFYKWRKRLVTQQAVIEPVPFIDLNTLVQREDTPRWEIELELGNGMRLSLRGG
jgi:transposase-like protein